MKATLAVLVLVALSGCATYPDTKADGLAVDNAEVDALVYKYGPDERLDGVPKGIGLPVRPGAPVDSLEHSPRYR